MTRWKNDWEGGTPQETPAEQARWFFGVLACLLLLGLLSLGVFLCDSYLYYNVGKAISGETTGETTGETK